MEASLWVLLGLAVLGTIRASLRARGSTLLVIAGFLQVAALTGALFLTTVGGATVGLPLYVAWIAFFVGAFGLSRRWLWLVGTLAIHGAFFASVVAGDFAATALGAVLPVSVLSSVLLTAAAFLEVRLEPVVPGTVVEKVFE